MTAASYAAASSLTMFSLQTQRTDEFETFVNQICSHGPKKIHGPEDREVYLNDSLLLVRITCTVHPTTFGSEGRKHFAQGGTTVKTERLPEGFEAKRLLAK